MNTRRLTGGSGMGRPTAEQIAAVVADLRDGRIEHPLRDGTVNQHALDRVRQPQPVVDATALYWDLHRRMFERGEAIRLYEDHPSVAPPWDDALVCYVNEHDNVIALQVHAQPAVGRKPWTTDNPVDWTQVRWIVDTFIWVGGRNGRGEEIPSAGPVHLFQHAVYGDGEPADIHWVHLLPEHDLTTWEVPLVVLGAVLNFLNCRNVELAEPTRPRPERRRLARTGVTVQTIVVRPVGKRTRSSGAIRAVDADDTPLTSVRGHFAHYGPQYDRGLLFGKYAGKFWVPGYARGAAVADEAPPKTYVLRP